MSELGSVLQAAAPAIGAAVGVGALCLTPAGIPLSVWYAFTAYSSANLVAIHPVAGAAVIASQVVLPFIPPGAKLLYQDGGSIHRAYSILKPFTG